MSRERFEQSDLFKYYSEHNKFIEFNGVNYKFNEVSKMESQMKLACMTVSLIAINGAWSAWQEQQKVVDELEARMAEVDKLMDAAASDGSECVEIWALYKALRGEP